MTVGPVLVTGAGGFVCSEIALALSRANIDVLAVDQTFDTATAARLSGIPKIEGPLLDVLARRDVPIPVAVIHGAAITASPDQLRVTRAAHIRRNVDMLTATLDFARHAGAARFVYLSSMGVFEPDDGPIPNGPIPNGPVPKGRLTEVAVPTATCAYSAAKRAGEVLTAAAADNYFTTLSLRLGNIAGPHEAERETRQHTCLVARMIDAAYADRIITVQTPEARREWSWLPDLADGIVRLIQNMPIAASRVLHAGNPPAINDLALARAIAERVHGSTVRLAPAPHAPVRPPMGTDLKTVFDQTKWTSMEAILDALIPARVAS